MTDTPPTRSPNNDLALTPVPIHGGQILGKPPGMTDEECGGLSVRIAVVSLGDGHLTHQYLSRRTLTPELPQLIAEGHDLLLSNLGGQPATMLYVADTHEPDAK